jgi:methylase of polypeptide subunit release factors
LPLVSDGVVFRVLRNLLVLDGERLSYRTLDVEQIGSVYETMMGFRLELASGPTIALRPAKAHGAPTAIDLSQLLAAKPAERTKWLLERTEQKLTGQAVEALKSAITLDDLLAALERRIARNATPHVLPQGAMLLQPSDERRRSGSHYTPRALTEPIVRTTLRPLLERLDERPTPEQVLDLKVCDIAVGSGAFLVEACRQLGEVLVKAWHDHGQVPLIPPDEDEVLHARRLIAQRCLYGVDKNPMAADLAKLSLWLATLARDHPFTFLDHAIRCGDSLVGLTRQQIADFHWRPAKLRVLGQQWLEQRIQAATAYRREILEADELVSPDLKRQKLDLADESLGLVREAGDLVIAAFFGTDRDRGREVLRDEYLGKFTESLTRVEVTSELEEALSRLRGGERSLAPFHWEIEFPEVFQREISGFDAIVGNPPFLGGTRVSTVLGDGYRDWLLEVHPQSHGNSDLVAHFYRRAFNLLRKHGCFGLIATNTIGQGDTRATGLRWICTHGGTIYAARKRYRWPGQAAVVVSVVNIAKDVLTGPYDLDSRPAPIITAYLFHAGGHENPATLEANAGKSFLGSKIYGQGFTFDDTDTRGVASPLSEMRRLIEKDPRNAERIFPYTGGEEVNDSPTHMHHRYVINFEDWPLRREDLEGSWFQAEDEEREAWLRQGVVPLDYPDEVAADYPDLLQIVEERVKPERARLGGNPDAERRKHKWWLWGRYTPALFQARSKLERVLAVSRVGQQGAIAFLPTHIVPAESLVLFTFDSYGAFCTLQSRPHEIWARFFASSLEDRLRYTPSDCFETFPFPESSLTPGPSPRGQGEVLEQAGHDYYEFRAALMVKNNEGLTKTYNRFHDPDETSPDILHLRELHAAMDRAVLDAYGWTDIPTDCRFLLDYEEEEDEDALTPGPSPRGRGGRKKPWRYRWPDEVRDEVLARLLALNAERAEEERLAGLAAQTQTAKPRRKRLKAGSAGGLFEAPGATGG